VQNELFKASAIQDALFGASAGHRLWKYAAIVSDTYGNLYVKDGDTRCNTRDEALDYAASETTGKARGLMLEEDILGVWDMTADAIRRDAKFDPTLIDEHYRKGYDNEIRPYMPLARKLIKNFRGKQSLELHPIPKERLNDPNWRELLRFEWNLAHEQINQGQAILDLAEYNARPYLVESFDKLSNPNIDKFLLAAATGAGKETSTLASLVYLHDVRHFDNTKLHVTVATIPSTVSELMNELASVKGMHVESYGYVDFSRIKVYIMRQWYDSYRYDCSPAAKTMMLDRATIVESVSEIPNTHPDNQVPVLFGGYHDLALKSETKLSPRYSGLDTRIGILSIGEAHQMLSTADNKLWKNLNDMFGNRCFKMFITGTPYDFIYGSLAAEFFDITERVLFTRNDLYKDKRTNTNSPYKDYPDFNFYGINIAEIIEHLKQDPNWKDDASGFTWSKLFAYTSDARKFIHEKTLLWLFKRMFGATAFDENGDPLSIYNAAELCEKAKQHIMVALPVGNKNASAKVYIGALKSLLIQHGIFEGDIFDAYDDDLGDRKNDIAKAQGRTLTLTCNKDCTGANIPELGSFVFLRRLGDSVKFFEQATGRVGRKYPGKTNCGVFIGDLEASMNIMITIEETISLDRGEDFSTRQIIESIISNYNFFTGRNGKWEQFTLPELADMLERLNARGNYGINQCVNFSSADKGFDLLFRNVVARESEHIELVTNGNKGAKNNSNITFEQLGLPFNKNLNPDQNWHNMKLSFLAKCRMLAFIYDVKTIAQCAKLVEQSIVADDKEILNIVGKGVEYFPVIMQDQHINIIQANRWLQKFNDNKTDIELLFEMLEDPSHRSDDGFVAEPNRLLRRIASKAITKLKKKTNISIIDVCAGRGGFLVYFITEAIAQGLVIDPNNIYYNDIDPTMVAFFKALNKTQGLGIPDVNITCKEFLSEEYSMKKFSVVLGNPPYNGKAALHQQFFNKGYKILEDDGVLAFIQPATTYFNKKDKQKEPVDRMIEIIKDNVCTVYIENPEVFDNAGIQNDLSITILQKTKSINQNIESITFKNGITHTNVPLEDISMTQINPVSYASIRSKYEQYVHVHGNLEYLISKKYGELKAVLGKIRGTRPTDDDFYTFIPLRENRTGYGASKNTDFGVKIDSAEQVTYVYDYLESYVARFGLALLKFSQNTANKEFALVPLVDFDKLYTDNELYKMLDLTDDEISEIKKVIVPLYGR
jgi:hypothetical protein